MTSFDTTRVGLVPASVDGEDSARSRTPVPGGALTVADDTSAFLHAPVTSVRALTPGRSRNLVDERLSPPSAAAAALSTRRPRIARSAGLHDSSWSSSSVGADPGRSDPVFPATSALSWSFILDNQDFAFEALDNLAAALSAERRAEFEAEVSDVVDFSDPDVDDGREGVDPDSFDEDDEDDGPSVSA